MRQSYGPYTPDMPDDLPDWEPVPELTAHRVPFGPMREDTVESSSRPGLYHHMKQRADGTWSCDCEGSTYTGHCHHVDRKMEEQAWR